MSPKIKNLLLGAAALVMLGVAGYLFITRGSAEAEFPTHYTVQAVCLETKDEFPITSQVTDRPPFKNPKTGRLTLYPWYFCNKCQYRFVPELTRFPNDNLPRLPVIPTCPNCGSQSAGSWVPSDPQQAKPAGTAALPALPK